MSMNVSEEYIDSIYRVQYKIDFYIFMFVTKF
jgi:hypothetical protein